MSAVWCRTYADGRTQGAAAKDRIIWGAYGEDCAHNQGWSLIEEECWEDTSMRARAALLRNRSMCTSNLWTLHGSRLKVWSVEHLCCTIRF